ncbi:hypothetical protein KEM60_02691 [Austwickia sp. TVS 96-490-7B]|uniref:ComEC/Rec2 family competence protein n=1 Tax=Austwickia sp. TVS 96-490-7B TaxID=2830843 RepID=UPI001C581693|nr:ComEC/Rec2 family competence protein [Austwickia sp. TVS 96-490-7B]MBW3086470.1 hypothetical protein [Austwickia sp. TVS 96-490-7B]
MNQVAAVDPATRLDLRLALPAAIAWACSAALLPTGPTVIVAAAVSAAALAFIAWVRRRTGRRTSLITISGAVTALVLTAAAAQTAVSDAGGVRELAAVRAVVTVEGRVGSDPRVLRAGPERRADRVLFSLDVDSVDGRGRRTPVATRILVSADPSWATRRWREKIRVTGRLAPPSDSTDVVALFTPTGAPEILAGPGAVVDVADHVRGRLREATAVLPADAAGLLPGLIVGDTSATPDVLLENMKTTGLTHLSAVSGSNVAVVLSAITGLSGLLRIPRRYRPILAAISLAAFVVLARPDPSVIRAAVMGTIGLVGMHTSRRAAGMPALSGAVVLLLVIDPWLARSFGFALSVLATAALLILARPWGQALGARLPSRWAFLGEAVAIPVAAQLVCAPLIVVLSGQISVVGVGANLLAAPLVGPATLAAVATAVVAVVHVGAAALPAWVGCLPAWGIAQVAHLGASLPYATVPWPAGTVGALSLAALTAVGLAAAPRIMWWVRRRRGAAVGALLVVAAGVAPTPTAGWPLPQWRFVACDVGQGDGLVIRSGERSAVVVDVGPRGGDIAGCLRRLDVDRIDAVLLSHLHEDHSGDLESVLAGWPVRELFVNPVDEPAADARRVRELAARHGLPVQRITGGDSLTWEQAHATVRTPRRRIDSGSVPNNNSAVLDVDAAGLRLLLMGDAEREEAADVRRELVTAGADGPVDVVKVAHHGSANADHELLRRLPTRLFVISVGADNTYGHPSPSVMSVIGGTGSQVRRTDRNGDVLVGVRAGEMVVTVRR